MDARITREETALLLNLTPPARADVDAVRIAALRARDEAVGRAIGNAFRAVFRGVGAFLGFLLAYRERAGLLRHLRAMSDRELADIGLTRADLSRVFDEDFAVPQPRAAAARGERIGASPAHA